MTSRILPEILFQPFVRVAPDRRIDVIKAEWGIMRVMSGILEAAGPMWSEELFLLDYVIVHFYDVLHVGGLSFVVGTCME